MTIFGKRVCVLLLAVQAVVVGTWAAVLPLSFYRDFPAPGWNWVSLLGPYNEHLVRDVGGLYLALAVLSVLTFRQPTVTLLRVTGGAWLIFNVEHWLWHALHLDVFSTAHAVGNMVGLSIPLLLSILLLLPTAAEGRKMTP
ncbi:hypothetical protein [Actinoplanes couchii]|uniref:Uncharacterized protein n=1 Tax=Actinoplanes couchii TaxID=403638 RepID=A0ABQ3XE03_9ACTN|nr:hypothetical protein [Actinoplanes couchii]MDR6317249.1 hypothetical protein [Actinoplanes couchii]GID56742.1 hypothetical protein Aco03nite_051460 [Actinoplanes couchii]